MQIMIKEILNFPCGKVVIKNGYFVINTSEGRVFVYIQDREDVDYYVKKIENTWEDIPVLYCTDIENRKISIVNCKVNITGTDCFVLLWQTVICGVHKETDKDIFAKEAEYTLVSPFPEKHLDIYLPESDYNVVEKCNISISIRKKQMDSRCVMQSVILPDEKLNVPTFYNIYLKLIEIFYLYLGFFPNVLHEKYILEDKTELLIIHRFSSRYSSNTNIVKYPRTMRIDKNLNMMEPYKKWNDIRNEEKASFNLFCFTERCEDYILEVPTATIIQCMEGYFRCHHQKMMEKFISEIKKEMLDIIEQELDISVEWKNLCDENGIESKNIFKSIRGLLGNLNKRSLPEILKLAVEYNQYTRMLFDYEHMHKTETGISYFHLFLKKAQGQRNWLSHLITQDWCFEGSENTFAREKLSLLFRLVLMHDIGLTVDISSLKLIIMDINSWYDTHQLKNRKKAKK